MDSTQTTAEQTQKPERNLNSPTVDPVPTIKDKEEQMNIGPKLMNQASGSSPSQSNTNDSFIPNSDSTAVNSNGKNAHKLTCVRCSCVVLNPDGGEFINEHHMSLPSIKTSADSAEQQSFSSWWMVRDVLHFENVGVSNSVDGKRYLCCADCELGPIGIQVDSHYYVAVEQLSIKRP